MEEEDDVKSYDFEGFQEDEALRSAEIWDSSDDDSPMDFIGFPKAVEIKYPDEKTISMNSFMNQLGLVSTDDKQKILQGRQHQQQRKENLATRLRSSKGKAGLGYSLHFIFLFT